MTMPQNAQTAFSNTSTNMQRERSCAAVHSRHLVAAHLFDHPCISGGVGVHPPPLFSDHLRARRARPASEASYASEASDEPLVLIEASMNKQNLKTLPIEVVN